MNEETRVPPEVVCITDPATGSTAEVLVSQGFNCFSWKPRLEEGAREMLWASDGFERGEGRPSSSGIPILFPFPGRIGRAGFSFEGKTFELPAGDAFGNALHGFVFNRPWRLTASGGAAAAAEFQGSVDAPETLGSWPSDYRISVRYTVEGRRLLMHAEYANAGDQNLPCGLGTHAYFRLPLSGGGSAAETVIRAPVDRQWDLVDMLPRGGGRAFDAETPLAAGAPLADHAYDTVYQVVDGAAPIVTEVEDPAGGRVVRQTTEGRFGCCVIYTPPHREAVCLEPYTCVPDPFHLESEGVSTGLQILAPGESCRTEIVLEVVG